MKPEQKQKEFFVSHLGQHVGPWSLSEIAKRLSDRQLLATDFLYDDQATDWVELSKHEGLLDVIAKEFKPKLAPVPKLEMPQVETETSMTDGWYIQKETHRFGPLSSIGVIKALQEKTIYDFEMIWKDGMTDWVRIAEHPEFSVDNVRELLTKQNNVFIKREFPRATLMNEVMVHDNRSLWIGQTFQGGEGGSGIIIPNATLQPGQTVNLHFAAHDGLPSFNAQGEIVSKKFVKELKNKKTPIPYGLKFLGIDSKLQNTLHEYFSYKTQPGWMFAGK